MTGASHSLIMQLFEALATLLVVQHVTAAPSKLPAAISACSRTHVNINECALQSARAALPFLIEGNEELGITPADPLHIPAFTVDDTKTSRQVALTLAMKDVDITGLRNMTIETMEVDVDGNSMAWTGKIPRLEFIGTYDVNGRVLLLPIKGNGGINITLIDVGFKYGVKLTGEGTDMLVKTENNKLDFSTKRVYVNLDNLFGDKNLSEEMNKFLNENWQELVKEMGPPIGEVLNVAVNNVVNKIITNVPLSDIFPA